MTQLSVVQGDFGYDINFTLQDANGNPFDLTGVSSLNFIGQLSSLRSTSFSGTMSVVSAIAGTCKYTVASGNFSTVGVYNTEIQASFTSTKTITFPNIQVTVGPSIPY
ncbi:MAG: BppU family phage baseplate upper protein [Nitrospiria bacterium]